MNEMSCLPTQSHCVTLITSFRCSYTATVHPWCLKWCVTASHPWRYFGWPLLRDQSSLVVVLPSLVENKHFKIMLSRNVNAHSLCTHKVALLQWTTYVHVNVGLRLVPEACVAVPTILICCYSWWPLYFTERYSLHWLSVKCFLP